MPKLKEIVEREPDFLDEQMNKPRRGRKSLLECSDETLRTIRELSKLFCTQKEIAAVLGVNERTFQNFLYKNEEAMEAWEDGLEVAKISLRRKQFALADSSAPVAIFLGKNYLGQKDESHHHTTVTKPVQEMTEAELLHIAQAGKPDSKSVN